MQGFYQPGDFIGVDIGRVLNEELANLLLLAAAQLIEGEHVHLKAWDHFVDAVETVGFQELFQLVHLGHLANVNLILVVDRSFEVGR